MPTKKKPAKKAVKKTTKKKVTKKVTKPVFKEEPEVAPAFVTRNGVVREFLPRHERKVARGKMTKV